MKKQSTFCHWWHFNWGGAAAGHPSGYAYAKDRPSRGQEHKCSPKNPKNVSRRPQKKRSSREKPLFRKKSGVQQKKKGLRKFSARFLPFSKVELKKGHGHGPFSRIKKNCCSRAEDRTFSRTSRLRRQGLQNVSSRTPSLDLVSEILQQYSFLFSTMF